MKTIKLLGTAIAVVLLFSFTSCEEAKEILPIPSMKATVGGEAWSSLASAGILATSTTPQTITVSGKPTLEQNVHQTIAVSVNGTTTGTYNQDLTVIPTVLECLILYTVVNTDQSTTVYSSTTATVTISKIDAAKKMLNGTFSGELVNPSDVNDKISITGGTFENIIYSEQ